MPLPEHWEQLYLTSWTTEVKDQLSSHQERCHPQNETTAKLRKKAHSLVWEWQRVIHPNANGTVAALRRHCGGIAAALRRHWGGTPAAFWRQSHSRKLQLWWCSLYSRPNRTLLSLLDPPEDYTKYSLWCKLWSPPADRILIPSSPFLILISGSALWSRGPVMQTPFLICTSGLNFWGCDANSDPEVRIKLWIKELQFPILLGGSDLKPEILIPTSDKRYFNFTSGYISAINTLYCIRIFR
jgi:hypothetical protein